MLKSVLRNHIELCPLVIGRCAKSDVTPLLKELTQRIKATGPLSVAQYMQEVLTHPVEGYYMKKDTFGSRGDFITSPEISQMFGEILGVWFVHEWQRLNSTSLKQIQLVEFGPGRGTLADDILRVVKQFVPNYRDLVKVALVEASPFMSRLQEEKLCGKTLDGGESGDEPYKVRSSLKHGVELAWYKTHECVPRETSFFLAHEFFDALPVHQLVKRDGGWREVCVDVDDSVEGDHHLRFVVSREESPACRLIPSDIQTTGEMIEISPQSGSIIQHIASVIEGSGGFSLIADYGGEGKTCDTLRGFQQHQGRHPLYQPGWTDVTVDVDFKYLSHAVRRYEVEVFGPITQCNFLHNMGIKLRLLSLFNATKDSKERELLLDGYRVLTSLNEMGERFKFMYIGGRRDKNEPAGFW